MEGVRLFFIIFSIIICATISEANNCILEVDLNITQDTLPNTNNQESMKSITKNKEYQSSGMLGGVNVDIGPFQRKLKKLNPDYTGYKVEVEWSRALLAPEDKLFQQFGNVSIEPIYKNNEHVAFAYTIGDFPKESSAMQFMQNIVKGRYPNAKIVYYEEGKRK